jgi:hypothetical protein
MELASLLSKELTTTFLLANTPMQLYKSFRYDSTVAQLSQSFKANKLLRMYERITNKKKMSLIDFVHAYAIIISFTFFDSEIAISNISKIDLKKIRWGEELYRCFLSEVTETVIDKIEVEPFVVINNMSPQINNYSDFKIPVLAIETSDSIRSNIQATQNLQFDFD